MAEIISQEKLVISTKCEEDDIQKKKKEKENKLLICIKYETLHFITVWKIHIPKAFIFKIRFFMYKEGNAM